MLVTGWTIDGGYADPSAEDTQFIFDGTTELDVPSNPVADVWTEYSFDVTATGSDTFELSFFNNPGFTGLDNFTGTNVASVSPTPLPAALALFTGGLGFMGLLGRRKKKQVAAA